jgi:hypothetical protein
LVLAKGKQLLENVMIPIHRLSRYSFAVSLAILSVSAIAATQRIIPVRTRVTFSSHSPESYWSVPIKAVGGKTAYFLSLDQQTDREHHPITLELTLRQSGYMQEGVNLLDPTRIRHGLQAYDFAADDLADGVEKSAFGKKRAVVVKDLGLVVQITVSKAEVSLIATGNHQIDALELQIEVDNSHP